MAAMGGMNQSFPMDMSGMMAMNGIPNMMGKLLYPSLAT